ncbi:MAG: flagellar basal-body rod protein FlgF [Bacteriovoracaceae bacterium]
MKNIWVPLSAAIAQQRNVETIANNVANANTPGFKRDQLVFKEYLTGLDKGLEDIDLPNREFSPEDFYHSGGAENAAVTVDGSYTIHAQGQMAQTGNSMDLALQGQGFFEVLTPNGIRYSRRGNLSISKDGELVTDQGYKVLKKLDPALLASQGREASAPSTTTRVPAPEERIIKIPNGKLSINLEGQIYSNGIQGDDLSIVEFSDLHALKKEGNSLYANPDNTNIKTKDNNTRVHQGMIEQSNVNAVAEMSELIKAHRHFESIQKAISTYDSIAGKAANEIGKF